jgi:short-subunit dehydrogenase
MQSPLNKARNMKKKKTILITGASNGIGAALAEEYASNGIFLAISGRDLGRLNMVAERSWT